MELAVTLERMPFGAYLGAPALRVEIAEGCTPTGRTLAAAIAEKQGPGVACIHLASVPWAAEWWPDVLGEAQHLLPDRIAAVGVLRVDALTWVSADVHWIMDATALFDREALAAGGLERVLEHVGAFPRTIDLIVREPDPAVVTPALLDGVAGHMMAERPGQILTTRWNTSEKLLPVLSRCHTPWSLVTS